AGQRPHQRARKLLVAPEAGHQGNLCERRAVPSVPVSRRTSVPVQHAQGRRRLALSGRAPHHRRATPDLQGADRRCWAGYDASVGGNDDVRKAETGPPPTPYERFVAATRQVLSVSKAELEKREKAWRKKRQRRKP